MAIEETWGMVGRRVLRIKIREWKWLGGEIQLIGSKVLHSYVDDGS